MVGRPASPVRDETLVTRIREWALSRPATRALTFLADGEVESASLTFGELDTRARAIAAALGARGAAGERALLLYPPGLDFVEAFLGCLYAGVIAVPASPPRGTRPSTAVSTIAADAAASHLLTTSTYLHGPGRRLREADVLTPLRWIETDTVNDAAGDQWVQESVRDHAIAFLQYTSGSTSAPKGVIVTHANLIHNERMIEQAFGHDASTSVVSWLPAYHDMGLIGMLLQPLYLGAVCTLMPPAAFLQRPLRWLQAIARYRATTSGAPNFAYDLCVRRINEEQRAALDLSSWTVAFNGSEPVRAGTLDRFAAAFASCGFRRAALYPCYGLAENTLIVSGGSPDAPPVVISVDRAALERHEVVGATAQDSGARPLVSCGHVLPDQSVAIVDPETGGVVAPSRVGEIWISGPSVGAGYWNQPDASRSTFVNALANRERPFLRSGDLGFMIGDDLFVTGRLKGLVIIAGQNHYPEDIEQTVEDAHPAIARGGVAACAVDDEGGERLVVVAEINRHQRRSVEADHGASVAAAAREAIAERHEITLHTLVLVEPGALPKTSSGKVRRGACRAAVLAGSFQAIATIDAPSAREQCDSAAPALPVPSREAIEAWLTSELARLVNVNATEIDTSAPFARYGLSSLMAVSMTTDLGLWMGRDLDATLLWDYPSIETLARHLAGEAPRG
jgi:acyl-CoA synthetase (AMP-forming)/AMP-acid ligase II/acyl carrier protein